MKSDNLQFIIDGNITFENILLNGQEDITKWNSQSANLLDCIQSKKQCCDGVNQNSILYPALNCSTHKLSFMFTTQNQSFFVVRNNGNLSFKDTSLIGLNFLSSNNFIMTSSTGLISIQNLTIV